MNHFVLHSRYYYSRLSPDNRLLYKTVYDSLVNGDSTVMLNHRGTGFEAFRGLTLHDIITYVVCDNPHLYHINTSSIRYIRCGQSIRIEMEALYTSEEYIEINKALVEATSLIIRKAKRFHNTIDMIQELHDELAGSIQYGLGPKGDRYQREAHSIVVSVKYLSGCTKVC